MLEYLVFQARWDSPVQLVYQAALSGMGLRVNLEPPVTLAHPASASLVTLDTRALLGHPDSDWEVCASVFIT